MNPDYTRVNDIPLDGYAYNLQVNKNTGKIFATIDDGTDTPTAVSIFDINSGKELMKIKSASCPSVSDDGSIFVFRNDETEEAVVSVVIKMDYSEPFFKTVADFLPCPVISGNGKVLVYDNAVGTDSGYSLHASFLPDPNSNSPSLT